MSKDIINPEQDIDNNNIFEDFAEDDSLWEEIKTIEEQRKKDIYFYLKLGSSVLKVWNLLLFFFLGIAFIYSFIQEKEEFTEYSFLSPICNLFLGEVASDINTCYSVSYYLKDVEAKLETQEIQQTKEVASLIGDIYLIDNFIYSKVVSFLMDTSKNSLQPIEILSHFDYLKNKFEPIDKSRITCSGISIYEPGVFEARCNAYSSDWDTDIPQIEGDIISQSKSGGTSISLASSFIDFIENNSESQFTVLDKQKVFFMTNVTGRGIYTKTTPFTLKLKYNSSQSIDF